MFRFVIGQQILDGVVVFCELEIDKSARGEGCAIVRLEPDQLVAVGERRLQLSGKCARPATSAISDRISWLDAQHLSEDQLLAKARDFYANAGT